MTALDRALSAASTLISSEINRGNAWKRKGGTGKQGFVWKTDQSKKATHWCECEEDQIHVNYVYCQINRIWVSRNNDVLELRQECLHGPW